MREIKSMMINPMIQETLQRTNAVISVMYSHMKDECPHCNKLLEEAYFRLLSRTKNNNKTKGSKKSRSKKSVGDSQKTPNTNTNTNTAQFPVSNSRITKSKICPS